MLRRIGLAFGLTLALLALPLTAAAKEPTIQHFSLDYAETPVPGLCAFDVTIGSTVQGTSIAYFDNSGAPVRGYTHATEQDTFIGPGGRVTSSPYTYNIEAQFDSAGNVIRYFAQGIILRVPLPNGTMFVSAGRVDILTHPSINGYIFTPDWGHSGNLSALCAAIA
jgi:hypothetical protein